MELKGGESIAKYRRKPIIVEVEVFKMGMEDGYAFYHLNGTFYGYCSKGEPVPRLGRKPCIKTLAGWQEVSEGDYILTDEFGNRSICKSSVFESEFEKIEE